MKFTPYQKFVVGLLAFLQFTVILDFMILSPLGAMLMPALQIGPSQFGLLISVYAFSAGASGLLAAGFADRFDRKRLLLFFYTGFVFGTLLCGLAADYHFLLIARMVTGVFGGVLGSISFAIITDLFPYQMRGRVMGVVQTAFAASQVLGLPLGLYLSNHGGWHAPFFMIVAFASAVGVVILVKLKPIDGHLKLRPDGSPFHHLIKTLSTPKYLHAFATTVLLSTGGFMLMPFGSAFTVNNLGISLDQLPIIYLVTGLCAIFTGPFVGRLSDRYGKFPIFAMGCVQTIVMVTIYTRLGITPVAGVILVNVIMFIGISSRMIASSALISAIPEPQNRGSFMSINSSVQQISGGFASVVAGLIVVQGPGGHLERFDLLGNVVCGATLITLGMMYTIHLRVRGELARAASASGPSGGPRPVGAMSPTSVPPSPDPVPID